MISASGVFEGAKVRRLFTPRLREALSDDVEESSERKGEIDVIVHGDSPCIVMACDGCWFAFGSASRAACRSIYLSTYLQ